MPRAPRIEFPGATFHVTARGNDQQRVFVDAIDCATFLALLGRVVDRQSWRCAAYCLMTNHVHLVVQLTEPTLGTGMSELLGQYARRFNRRHGRREHLFGSRYHPESIEDERHLLVSARYVVLNPVRAGACARPDDWLWSSYRATAHLAPAPPFLDVEWILAHFGRGRDAPRRYAEFVRDGVSDPLGVPDSVPGTVPGTRQREEGDDGPQPLLRGPELVPVAGRPSLSGTPGG